MSHRFWLSVLVWFLSLSAVFGQADSSLVYLRVRLINADTHEPIPFAHILFMPAFMGITSDVEGNFETNLSLATIDSLRISSIGYENQEMAMTELSVDSTCNIVYLNPKIYMLSEVKITQYPSYEELVEAITNPEYTEDEKKILRVYDYMDEAGLRCVASESGQKSAGGPISVVYNLFSKAEKSRRKFEELIKEDQHEVRFTKIFSPEIIKRITGINDRASVSEFIKYCNFSNHQLDNSSEYELFILIQQKFKVYRKGMY